MSKSVEGLSKMKISTETNQRLQENPAVRAEVDAKYIPFSEYIVFHQNLLNAAEEVFGALELASAEPSLIFVIGATSVGKTTVMEFIATEIARATKPSLSVGQVPFVSMTVTSVPPRSRFDWRDVFTRLLRNLGDPFLDKRTRYPAGAGHAGPADGPNAHLGTTTGGLRRCLENALKLRKPRAILLDEAQHLGQVSRGEDLYQQVDMLKSLATATGVPIVLFGTYNLVSLLRLNAQLEDELPVPCTPTLLSQSQMLYRSSVGSVGLLKLWLNKALKGALINNAESIDKAMLEATRFTDKQCLDILNECDIGESKFQPTPAEEAALDNALKIRPLAKASPQPKGKPPLSRKPFIRKPSRDPVGV